MSPRLSDALVPLGPSPPAEAVFRAFAAWCGATASGGRTDRAWLSLDHPYGPGEPTEAGAWALEVELAREVDGDVTDRVVLRFPLPDPLRARLDAPAAQRAWTEPPDRADRLWGLFRARFAALLAPFSPRLG